MEYKVSAFKVIINGVKAYSWIIRSLVNNGCNPNVLAELDYDKKVIAFDIYIWPIRIGYASYWIIRKSRILPGISCATGDLIGKLINKLDDHFGADYDINLVSSQITMVIVNKMRIVLTLVNSNLGLYNLSSELRMLISNRWSWPSLFAFNIFSVRPANSGLFYL